MTTANLRLVIDAIDTGRLPDSTEVTSYSSGPVHVNVAHMNTYDVEVDVRNSVAAQSVIANLFPGGEIRVETILRRSGPRRGRGRKRREHVLERCTYRVNYVVQCTFFRPHTTHSGFYISDTQEQGDRRWVPWRHKCCHKILLQSEIKQAGLR